MKSGQNGDFFGYSNISGIRSKVFQARITQNTRIVRVGIIRVGNPSYHYAKRNKKNKKGSLFLDTLYVLLVIQAWCIFTNLDLVYLGWCRVPWVYFTNTRKRLILSPRELYALVQRFGDIVRKVNSKGLIYRFQPHISLCKSKIGQFKSSISPI